MPRLATSLLVAALLATAVPGPAHGGVEAFADLARALAERLPVIPRTLEPLRPVKVPIVKLTVIADAACLLSVDGGEAVALEPGEPLELEVPAGARKLVARSTASPSAVWEDTVELEAPKGRRVRVPMVRTIRARHLEERREAVYRDEKTGLMWARRDNGMDVSWKAAAAFCERSTLAGFEDWRLPTIEELASIDEMWSQRAFKIVGGVQLTACCPWSADREGGDRAWNFNYRFRRPFPVNVHLSLDLRSLCARTMTPEDSLPPAGETGETDAKPSKKDT